MPVRLAKVARKLKLKEVERDKEEVRVMRARLGGERESVLAGMK